MADSLSATAKSVKAIVFIFLLLVSYANAARLLDEIVPESPPVSTLPSGQTTATIPPTAAASNEADLPLDKEENPAVTTPPTTAAADEADPPLNKAENPATTPATAAANDEADPPVDKAENPATTPPTAAAVDGADPPVDKTENPATTPPTAAAVDGADPPVDKAENPATPAVSPPVTVAAPIPGPTTATTLPNGPASTASTSATVAKTPLSFFMHDILGGSHPSVRVVTGLIARTDINGIPFSVPNNNFFPLQGGTPLANLNNLNNLINPNTAPLLSGLNGAQTSTVLQNTGNNNNVVNGNNRPFVTAGQLPAGSALQKLMFGSITVIDDELTEGHELGSAVIGKAQGFYLASSMDGTSHTMALTLLLHDGGDHHDSVGDTISFFGVHRTASPESQVAVIGGTGKYENASGYASIESIQQEDQHITDGVDTIVHVSVYLSE
ncbi:hypothetical protein K2173_010000 [Erythroxylum novogranatense]|uniref:Dirigent protein n=1 Tax=Erythroxylum novogranatense TaxID=1862640 RepID=A0AAV8T1B9_9ROSI|nr:hypothetical protein K2173_010000 [Erythroxylum novogranatense]